MRALEFLGDENQHVANQEVVRCDKYGLTRELFHRAYPFRHDSSLSCCTSLAPDSEIGSNGKVADLHRVESRLYGMPLHILDLMDRCGLQPDSYRICQA